MFNFSHLASVPRLYPHRFCVENIGYIAHKKAWVNTEFKTFNFSFILRGEGEYRIEDRIFPVSGPCVITQWPGLRVTYGPHEDWEELYLIYDAADIPLLKACGFADSARPAWHARDAGTIRKRLAQLEEQFNMLTASQGCADRIDRICDSLILESLLDRTAVVAKVEIMRIEQARNRLEKASHVAPDVEAMACECGMSIPTFRRYWARVVGTPPTTYVQQLRMQQASRLLVESDLAVQSVANRVGYEDPLYFSRVFKRSTGFSPTAYRRRYEDHLRLG